VKPSFSAFALPFAQVSRRGVRTSVWGQVRPRSGRQPYRLQQFRDGRWHSVGGIRLTTPDGFLRRVVSGGRGSQLRIWSPRDQRYSAILRIT
jgi:hypothetical protein